MVFVGLQSIAAGVNRMICPTYPDRAVLVQNILAGTNPGLVEFKIIFHAPAFVPVPLVHGHHAASMTGSASIGKVVWGVGEYHVHGFRGEGEEEGEAVGVVEGEVFLLKIWLDFGNGWLHFHRLMVFCNYT